MTTKNNKPTVVKFLFSVLITSIIFPLVVLLAAGDWLWLEGWIFGLWFDVMVISNMLYLYRNDPDLMAERSKAPGSDNQKPWDKYLLTFAYVMAVVWFIIMPIDAKRLAWSLDFSLFVKIIGGILLIPALYLIYQATAQNTYLSTMVRLQSERKQQVISTGVYRFVRHPLYLG
ncbi:MAG: isoprenylcysteine carboxyl methyltransferase, partial [Anaerolineaceae bacterium]|nr:isoprenylcysteine carboxyl methyltransferase [Anaerolineaceae bacterium]